MIFDKAPHAFKKEMDIVGCYIEHNGNILLLYRHAHKINGNKYGLPAGKVERGETVRHAMAREIHEETGLKIEQEKLSEIGMVYVRNSGQDFQYHMFKYAFATKPHITINPAEHKNFIWASPKESLSMDLIHDLGECIKEYYKLT